MVDDRRTLIADAVITTLAEVGSRGLTHRAVDEAARLPPGSTSYYLRTRASLLEAAVRRLAELDAASVPSLGRRSVASVLAQMVEDQLTDHRARLLARYELSLEAVRRPELRQVLAEGTEQVRDAVAARLAEDGTDQPRRLADDVLAMLEGLLFSELTAGNTKTRSRSDVRRCLERVLGD